MAGGDGELGRPAGDAILDLTPVGDTVTKRPTGLLAPVWAEKAGLFFRTELDQFLIGKL